MTTNPKQKAHEWLTLSQEISPEIKSSKIRNAPLMKISEYRLQWSTVFYK